MGLRIFRLWGTRTWGAMEFLHTFSVLVHTAAESAGDIEMSEVQRTMFAQAGSDLASEFEMASEGLIWGQITVAEPEMSTGGGKAARQSMMLHPAGHKHSIMLGWVNVAEKTAEVRDRMLVDEAWRTRYSEALPVEEADYASAVQLVEFLLLKRQISARRVTPSFQSQVVNTEVPVDADPRQRQLTILSVAFIAAVVAVVVLLLVR